MSVIRYDLEKCIGCRMCIKACPMDVFRYNAELKKSVIAYPESCITCGQCYLYCPAGSLALSSDSFGQGVNGFRPAAAKGFDRKLTKPAE